MADNTRVDETEPVEPNVLSEIMGGKPAAIPKPGAGQLRDPQRQAVPQAEQPSESPQEAEADEEGVTPEDVEEEEKPVAEQPEIDDETVFTVQIEGKSQEVTFAELRDNYALAGATEQRLQQASLARKEALQTSSVLYDMGNAAYERIQQLDKILQNHAEPQVDWDQLKATNLNGYLLARDQQRQAQEARQLLAQESQEIQRRQEQIASQATKQYIDEQAALLASKMPILNDPDKAPAVMDMMVSALTYYGYSTEELKNVKDHRIFIALHDAARYRALVNKKATSKKTNGTAKSIPNASRRATNLDSSQKQKELLTRAQKTGHWEDVAMTMIVPNSQGRQRRTL